MIHHQQRSLMKSGGRRHGHGLDSRAFFAVTERVTESRRTASSTAIQRRMEQRRMEPPVMGTMIRVVMMVSVTYLATSIVGATTATAQSVESVEPTDAARETAPDRDPSFDSPSPRFYMGREIAQTMHYSGARWLIRESRQREEDCATMLRELRLKPGMVAVDMGCGNGFYSLKMAKTVGDPGRVLAVDIQPEMLRLLQSRASDEGIENVEAILGTLTDPKLPTDLVDLVLCVDVYHEFSHPEQMLSAIRKSLRPDGVVVLVEYRTEDPAVPIKRLHKMSKAQVNKELTANGFTLVRQFDGLPWQHMMFFGKASPEQEALKD